METLLSLIFILINRIIMAGSFCIPVQAMVMIVDTHTLTFGEVFHHHHPLSNFTLIYASLTLYLGYIEG